MSLFCNIIMESAIGTKLRIPNITIKDLRKRFTDTLGETPPLKRRAAFPEDI